MAISGTVPELIDPAAECRFAGRCPHEAPVCRNAEPQPSSLGERHEVACFIHNGAPDSAELPSFERRVR